jgi:O-antigen/teichoic acid export membrane protein
MKEKIILWAALLATICVVISYYAQEIISIVYGNDYQFAAELIKWFALAHLLMAVVKMLHIYCRTMSANKFIKFGGWFSLILTCIFIIPMVYIYGYTGAMIIMVGQQLVLLYCLNRGYIFVNNSNGAGKAQGIIKG